MAEQRRDSDRVISELAARQHGVVTRRQLQQAGVSADAIDRRLRRRQLGRLHRGVYRVGPLQAPREREMAAVLACGAGALLSHESAVAAWQLTARPRAAPIDVIAGAGQPRRTPGLRVHRIRTVRPEEATTLDAIPITTPARTLYDFASVAPARELEAALAEAFDRRLTDRAALLSLLSVHPARPGTRRLLALLESLARPALTRSEAEARFLGNVRTARLPEPEANARVHGYRVDFFWPAEQFVVEIDGFAFHSTARMFESDRRRDAVLAAAGVRVMRVTWRQLTAEPVAVIARVAQALALARVR